MPKRRTRSSWYYHKNNFRLDFFFLIFTFAFLRLRDFPFLVVCTVYIIRVQKIRETWRNDNQLNWCKIYWWDLVQYAPIESLVWTFWTLFVCVKSMKQQGTWLANGSWFISKDWMFCPKNLYLSPIANSLFLWAIHKPNISHFWNLQFALNLV